MEAERALDRLTVMQDMSMKVMMASCALNVGVVLYVSGLLAGPYTL